MKANELQSHKQLTAPVLQHKQRFMASQGEGELRDDLKFATEYIECDGLL